MPRSNSGIVAKAVEVDIECEGDDYLKLEKQPYRRNLLISAGCLAIIGLFMIELGRVIVEVLDQRKDRADAQMLLEKRLRNDELSRKIDIADDGISQYRRIGSDNASKLISELAEKKAPWEAERNVLALEVEAILHRHPTWARRR